MGVALQLARAVQGGAAAAGRTAAAPPSVSSSMLRLDPDTVIAGRVRVDLSSFPYPPKIPPSLSSSIPSSSNSFCIFSGSLLFLCLLRFLKLEESRNVSSFMTVGSNLVTI